MEEAVEILKLINAGLGLFSTAVEAWPNIKRAYDVVVDRGRAILRDIVIPPPVSDSAVVAAAATTGGASSSTAALVVSGCSHPMVVGRGRLSPSNIFLLSALSGMAVTGASIAIRRYWKERKERQEQLRRRDWQQRQLEQRRAIEEEEEVGDDVPEEGQECVICLTRRRRSAFLPCGHLVCCQRCARSLLHRDLAPTCPVCRQPIRSSAKIYI